MKLLKNSHKFEWNFWTLKTLFLNHQCLRSNISWGWIDTKLIYVYWVNWCLLKGTFILDIISIFYFSLTQFLPKNIYDLIREATILRLYFDKYVQSLRLIRYIYLNTLSIHLLQINFSSMNSGQIFSYDLDRDHRMIKRNIKPIKYDIKSSLKFDENIKLNLLSLIWFPTFILFDL